MMPNTNHVAYLIVTIWLELVKTDLGMIIFGTYKYSIFRNTHKINIIGMIMWNCYGHNVHLLPETEFLFYTKVNPKDRDWFVGPTSVHCANNVYFCLCIKAPSYML